MTNNSVFFTFTSRPLCRIKTTTMMAWKSPDPKSLWETYHRDVKYFNTLEEAMDHFDDFYESKAWRRRRRIFREPDGAHCGYIVSCLRHEINAKGRMSRWYDRHWITFDVEVLYSLNLGTRVELDYAKLFTNS